MLCSGIRALLELPVGAAELPILGDKLQGLAIRVVRLAVRVHVPLRLTGCCRQLAVLIHGLQGAGCAPHGWPCTPSNRLGCPVATQGCPFASAWHVAPTY